MTATVEYFKEDFIINDDIFLNEYISLKNIPDVNSILLNIEESPIDYPFTFSVIGQLIYLNSNFITYITDNYNNKILQIQYCKQNDIVEQSNDSDEDVTNWITS